MNKVPKNKPDGDDKDCLCDVVTELESLYSIQHEDAPESVLSSFPDTTHIVDALKILIDVMLPGRMSPGKIESDDFDIYLLRRLSHAWRLLRSEVENAIPFRWKGAAARMEGPPEHVDPHAESKSIMMMFVRALPQVRKLLIEDIKAAYEGDPAALTYAEVQIAYPGLLAITSHRIAHELYKLDLPIVPRVMSEWTHAETGVDIHPGARIGRGLFIDHATGVVIGETCEIGNRVKIYQGVTLGAKSFPLDENGHPIKHIKRHPSVGDEVVIYANCTILGDISIGKGTTIGGNVYLMQDVAPNSFVSQREAELKIKSDEMKG